MTNDKILSSFGARVKDLRRQRGLTQQELAFRCNLHRTYVVDIERGSRNVSLLNIAKLAEGLEIPMRTLFPD